MTARQLNMNSIGYAEIRSAILVPKCLGCHGGDKKPDLTSYAAVKRALQGTDSIESDVMGNDMPFGGPPLSDTLKAYLEKWIAMGAPEVAVPQGPTQNSPPDSTGSEVLRPVTFKQVEERVLKTNCTSCHAIGNKHGRTELETYKSVMSVQDWLYPVVFWIADGAVVPPDSQMPPPKSPQLTDEQKALLLLWINDGFKE